MPEAEAASATSPVPQPLWLEITTVQGEELSIALDRITAVGRIGVDMVMRNGQQIPPRTQVLYAGDRMWYVDADGPSIKTMIAALRLQHSTALHRAIAKARVRA